MAKTLDHKLFEYFARSGSPAESSWVGQAMTEFLRLRPDILFEDARRFVKLAGKCESPTACATRAIELERKASGRK